MSAYIYVLYSTRDGIPRYVGKTDEINVSQRFNKHITRALEYSETPVYVWFRSEWEAGFDIQFFTVQQNIRPADLAAAEQYWIDQFGNLLNVQGNSQPDRANTKLGSEISAGLQQQLKMTIR